MNNIRQIFDPIYHHLATISDSTIVNVELFQITADRTLKPLVSYQEIDDMLPFRFSTSPAAKEYHRNFLKIQENYQKRISFEKSILHWKNNY